MRVVQPGDGDRFQALFETHWDPVHRYAQRRVDSSAAADVAADVFVVAWRRLDEVPAEALPWLYGVARKVVGNHWRSSARAERLLDRMTSAHAVIADQRATLSDPAATITAAVGFSAAFDQLSVEDRELLGLLAWEGLDARRAAVALGCNVGAVTMRLTRARRRLRSLLNEQEH